MAGSDGPQSRRALLGAALGAIAATVAGALGRPAAVRANDPNDVLLGGLNNEISTTRIVFASNASSAVAFAGTAPAGVGVQGASTSGTGIFGQSESLVGVHGQSTSGTGVVASAPNGFGLVTVGRTSIWTSGVALIPAGNTQKIVVPNVDVTAASFVLLTPQVNLGGRDLWYKLDTTRNHFTVRMSSPRTGNTRISWMLLG